MKLLEYEAKNILRQHNIPVPKSNLASEKGDVTFPVVLKSQVPVGGRGKAGGIKVVTSEHEYTESLTTIRSLEIKGFTPKHVLVEEALDIARELYISIMIDRAAVSITILANPLGGIEVESNDDESFLRIDLSEPNYSVIGEQLAELYDIPEKTFVLEGLVKNLHTCLVKNDAMLIEINPLVVTANGGIVAGDCKMELDDAALFRHPEWQFEDTPADVNFVTIDPNGNVATIANGAGLGMATVDAVADYSNHLSPANFLDIGGGANSESVLEAFRNIMNYKQVKVIVINIFAGITRCDEVAKAIVEAQAEMPDLPKLSIRLAGTNFEEAVAILDQHNINTFATLEECLAYAKEVAYE